MFTVMKSVANTSMFVKLTETTASKKEGLKKFVAKLMTIHTIVGRNIVNTIPNNPLPRITFI